MYRDGRLLPGVGLVSGYIALGLDYSEYAFDKLIHYVGKALSYMSAGSVDITPPTYYDFKSHMYITQMQHPFETCPIDMRYPQYVGIFAPILNLTPSDWLRRYYAGTSMEHVFVSSVDMSSFCNMVNAGYYTSSTCIILASMILFAAYFGVVRDVCVYLSIDILYLIGYIGLFLAPSL